MDLEININNSINKMESRFIVENRFEKTYPFPTENVRELFRNYDFAGKECLTVLGSSAQLFNMYLNGADKVTCFDTNPISYYYFNFLKAFIKSNLSTKKLLDLLCENTDCTATYRIISEYIEGDSKIYWDTLYEIYGSKIFVPQKIFHYIECRISDIEKYSGYLYDYQLEGIRKNIDKINPVFINCNILDLKGYLNGYYDFMYFSNIIQYSDIIYPFDSPTNALVKYKEILNSLLELLNTDGLAYLGYIYEYNNLESHQPWFDVKTRDEVFSEENYYYESFSAFGASSKEKTDGCLIYRK